MYSILARRALCRAFLLTGLVVPVRIASAITEETPTRDSSKDETVYEPGGDVKPPRLVHYVEPQFSPSSKEAFVEGTVKISTIVTKEGLATDARVLSGLNAEEDRTAVEAVKQWKFEPGTRRGAPVKVKVTVQVDFHLL